MWQAIHQELFLSVSSTGQVVHYYLKTVRSQLHSVGGAEAALTSHCCLINIRVDNLEQSHSFLFQISSIWQVNMPHVAVAGPTRPTTMSIPLVTCSLPHPFHALWAPEEEQPARHPRVLPTHTGLTGVTLSVAFRVCGLGQEYPKCLTRLRI